MDKINVRSFTQGELVASSRFRIIQLEKSLAQYGISMEFCHAQSSSYPPSGFKYRVVWFLKEIFARLKQVIKTTHSDINILQREFISTIYSLEGMVRGKKILDVDDAVWLRKKGVAIDRIAQKSDFIVCGNSFIASYFKKFDRPIRVIPTAVNTARFLPSKNRSLVIGWSGGSSAFNTLYDIEEELFLVLTSHPNWKLRVVADKPPKFSILKEDQVEFIEWSPAVEVESISTMSIGLMPLVDNDWSKGKCSYKMLLYMACGLPVVVSSVGMNAEVLGYSDVGFGVKDKGEWKRSLIELIQNPRTRIAMGTNGRNVVESRFSLEVVSKSWNSVIKEVASS